MIAKHARRTSWLPLLAMAFLVGCGKEQAPAPAPVAPQADAKGKIQGPPTAFQPPAGKSTKKGR